jgi:hypothetical protein
VTFLFRCAVMMHRQEDAVCGDHGGEQESWGAGEVLQMVTWVRVCMMCNDRWTKTLHVGCRCIASPVMRPLDIRGIAQQTTPA